MKAIAHGLAGSYKYKPAREQNIQKEKKEW